MRFKLVIGSAALLAIAFVINTAFLNAALSDGYQVSEVKRYLAPIESARDAIELTLGNNIRLSIPEMREVLDRQQQAINRHWRTTGGTGLDPQILQKLDLVNISIVLKSGSKLVTTDRRRVDRATPAELVEQILDISNGRVQAGLQMVEDSFGYYVPYLLFDDQGRWFGSLVFRFEKNAMRYAVAYRLGAHFLPTLIIGIFGAVGMLWLNYKLVLERRLIGKKDLVVDFVLIMLVSLACSLATNTLIFERKILELSADSARATAAEISAAFSERLSLRKNGTNAERRGPVLSEFFGRFDNFEAITLSDDRGRTVFRHRPERPGSSPVESLLQTLVVGHLSATQFTVSERLQGIRLRNGSEVTAVIRISRSDIYRVAVAMLLKGATMLFLTVLVMVECLLLYLHLLTKRDSARSAPSYELGFVRPAMFLFLFAIDLSMSFLPLHMQLFDAELFGLSKDIVAGLPISAEFLCVGIFLLVAGVWMDRRGWHEPFFVGLLVVGIGTLWSWATDDALRFILSRALVGVGYGLTLMSAQGLVIRRGGSKGRARGFANLFAGLYSGSICGAAAGAILAERFGYGRVFFLGALIVLLLMAFSWKFLGSAIESKAAAAGAAEKPHRKVELAPLLRFIGNPVFIALNLLSSLPASIAVAGFLHYFTPVYLDQIGVRDSTIGQVLILYGICLIYFGPSIGRLIDRTENKKYYMLTGGLLGGLAFATFNTDFGVASVIVAVFLLGLSSSFVLSSQSTIVLELKQSRELGEGTALGIFRSISRVGQVVGPIIFGWVLLSGDLTDVINMLGYAYLGAMLILAAFVINHPGKMEDRNLALQN